MNRAFYGDIHGCYDELRELYRLVNKTYPNIEHWHAGDLVDRGPESGKCVEFARDFFTGGVMGNHEDTIIRGYHACKRHKSTHRNPDKARTISQLNDETIKYLEDLPFIHIFDDTKLVLVHGGVFPKMAWHRQPPRALCRLQMFHKYGMDNQGLRWWGGDASNQPKTKKTEEQSREDGYVRWYEVYDHEYDCIYGHSVMGLTPHIHQNEGYGRTIGIDTGSCFGGFLTAYIHPTGEVIQVPCKEYVAGKNVRTFKGMTYDKK